MCSLVFHSAPPAIDLVLFSVVQAKFYVIVIRFEHPVFLRPWHPMTTSPNARIFEEDGAIHESSGVLHRFPPRVLCAYADVRGLRFNMRNSWVIVS